MAFFSLYNYIIQIFKIQLPQVNPPPIAHKAKISFFFILPDFIAVDIAKGIDAADVLA